MASMVYWNKWPIFIVFILFVNSKCSANDILGCGGFVKSHVKLDFSEIEIGLYTKDGSLKEKTECAPTNGYYFLPFYEKGDYVLKVHPPAGLSFEPSQYELSVDGVTDKCSTGQDINFSFNGFGINGKVVTAGQKQGPSGIAVQLVNEKGEKRNTVTTVGGDFHFTAVIPGKYTVKASHPKWKLEPSQVEVEMKEGKLALPSGVVLTVKGYDVSGSVTSFGSPISGLYVLLYSTHDLKYRVEGCNTALLQGVPDSPICHVTTDDSGEFSFGVVPAGEYKLMALSVTPGKPGVTYNVKPDVVPFTVRHDSLFIKNAFEVTGFTVVGTVEAKAGTGLPGVRVLLDGTPVGNSDAVGKFTLARLLPGVYTVSFQHEECEIDDLQVRVDKDGTRGVSARAARWRVCGTVAGGGTRTVALRPERGAPLTATTHGSDGKWCIFLPAGVYTAKVDVSEQEQREGLNVFPVSQRVSVPHAAVSGVSFSRLAARVSGRVQCAACERVQAALAPLGADGAYVAAPITTAVKDGEYTFTEVSAGSVEVSISGGGVCWEKSSHIVPVSSSVVTVPPFKRTGYLIYVLSDHDIQVEYKSKSSSGTLVVARGRSEQCLPSAEVYTLTPRGCHQFTPPNTQVDTTNAGTPSVHFVATAHAVGVRVISPEPVTDLTLTIDRDNTGSETVGPLTHTQDGGAYVFEHTVYMAEGEVASVAARSQSLVFDPRAPQQAVGSNACQPRALTIRAVRAITLKGQLIPPVADVIVVLHSDEGEVSQTTSADGTYRFGPLDASQRYRVEASKESYVFSQPDDDGNIKAQKLAEILVEIVDDVDGKPLQGALVSVSGGSYRRNVVSGGEGGLRFPALAAAQYYVKPHMKEYRFQPPHAIVDVEEGNTHTLALRGVRVAWSCHGSLVSLAGVGWGGAVLVAVPLQSAPAHCAAEDATTETSGAFRIRGLLPECEYRLQLKESSAPEVAGLKIARGPASLKVVGNRDIVGVRVVGAVTTALTDGAVRVHAQTAHYRSLTLTLALENTPDKAIYSTKVDAAGYTELNNPGVMYVLPRLPADNKTYVVRLESTLGRAAAQELVSYFVSDGSFKRVAFEFAPEVKATEQEVRHSTLLLIPLILAALLYRERGRLPALCARLTARTPRAPARHRPAPVLDTASIDHILNAVNAAGKKPSKKKLA